MVKQRLIFVVDDDPMYNEMLVLHLSDNPINVIKSFSTGEDCLKHLYESPDIVVLDYNLDTVVPDAMDGMKILDKIRKEDDEIKVIMLSSQEQYGVAMQTIRHGAVQYLIKDAEAFKKIDELLKELR
jgi:DNA-binding NarL/FixJ family response regulator